jgi:hypothetical protein
LTALLAEESIRDKANLLDLLWLLASARPEIGDERKWPESTLRTPGGDLEREARLSRSYVRRTRQALRRDIPAYLDFLDDGDPQVVLAAARLLSVFSRDAQRILPGLLAKSRTEIDEDAKATLVWAAGRLLAENREIPAARRKRSVDALGEMMAPGEGRLVRFAAAAAQLRAVGNRAAGEAVDYLIESVSRHDEYPPLPWGAVPLWDACDALCELSGAKRLSAFEGALASAVDPGSAHDIAITFLNRVFVGKGVSRRDLGIGFGHASDGSRERTYTPNFEVRPLQELSREQRSALQIVVASDRFWEIRNNLLAAYGLPNSREEARALIERASG